MSEPEVNINELNEDQLAEALWGEDRPSAAVRLPEDEPTEEPKEEPEPEPTPEPEPEAPAAEAPPEPEPDLSELEKQERELKERRLLEQLELLQAHNSRLAGKLGFLENKLKEVKPAAEPEYRPDPEAEPEVERLKREFQTLREEREAEKRAQALAEEAAAARARYAESKYTPEEIAAAAEKFAPMWQEALDAADTNSARELARAVMARVSTEIETTRLAAKIKAARELKATSESKRAEVKKAATISGSGAAPTPPSRPKRPDEMTPDELAKAIWG